MGTRHKRYYVAAADCTDIGLAPSFKTAELAWQFARQWNSAQPTCPVVVFEGRPR